MVVLLEVDGLALEAFLDSALVSEHHETEIGNPGRRSTNEQCCQMASATINTHLAAPWGSDFDWVAPLLLMRISAT